MKILKPNSFCQFATGEVGVAMMGTFASAAWMISDEAYKNVLGTKFAWTDSKGQEYVDHRDNFTRPNEEKILEEIIRNPMLKTIALQRKLIEE